MPAQGQGLGPGQGVGTGDENYPNLAYPTYLRRPSSSGTYNASGLEGGQPQGQGLGLGSDPHPPQFYFPQGLARVSVPPAGPGGNNSLGGDFGAAEGPGPGLARVSVPSMRGLATAGAYPHLAAGGGPAPGGGGGSMRLAEVMLMTLIHPSLTSSLFFTLTHNLIRRTPSHSLSLPHSHTPPNTFLLIHSFTH